MLYVDKTTLLNVACGGGVGDAVGTGVGVGVGSDEVKGSLLGAVIV